MRKHGYCEGIYGGLRLESATPTALKYSIRNMNYVISRQNIWWITSKRYNTYGVVPCIHNLTLGSLYYSLATLGYQKRNTYGVD
ncbi:MAG: hypothetical protein HXO12_02925 [Prevotella salivae]|nr:hypothetical protein [Segatella salivae]